jgi:predicted dehydrogenase
MVADQKCTDRRLDSDFRTLRHLVAQDALGDIKEAEIHYDIPSPGWISGWTQQSYSPGEGMMFGLGTHAPVSSCDSS